MRSDIHSIVVKVYSDPYSRSSTGSGGAFRLKNQRRMTSAWRLSVLFLLFHFTVFAAEIGITFLGVGFALTALGIMLFFEKNLLKFGNVMLSCRTTLTTISTIMLVQLFFLSGISLFIGPERVVSFIIQPHRLRATIIVLLGMAIVSFS